MPRRFTLIIDMKGPTFQHGDAGVELARLLRALAEHSSGAFQEDLLVGLLPEGEVLDLTDKVCGTYRFEEVAA